MARVLVVDDDGDSCEAMAGVLSKRGHDVRCAPNGREALSQLIADTPDIIILDVLMPEMTGVELLRILRSYLRLQHLPVLLITAYPESPELREVENLEVLGVLPKVNLNLSEVADLVDRYTVK